MNVKVARRKLIKQCGLALTALTLPFPLTAFIQFNSMTDSKHFDVIIIGGSYAGLSAAMALGRSLRNVLLIDSGLPCNRQTPHSHNFITQDGETPKAIGDKAKAQVLQYNTVQFINDTAIAGTKRKEKFTITTLTGKEFTAEKIIIAAGMKDLLPDIKGFSACWGISVIHCPYCHGYEFRDQPTGIIANGERAFHLASLVHNLTDTVSILAPGSAAFTREQLTKLNTYNIKIIEKEITAIEHTNGYINHVIFKDGSKAAFTAVYAAVPFEQHSTMAADLGCELTEQGYIKTDMLQKTSIPGVFACGDSASMMRSVASAVYTGNLAGAMVNKELTDEQF